MLKVKKVLIIALILCSFIPGIVFASDANLTNLPQSDTMVIQEENEPYFDEFNKTVEKDLYLWQDYINIDYDVIGNVYVMAKQLNISGYIEGNLFVLAEDFDVKEGSEITGDIFACSDRINIEGKARNLYCVANKLNIGKLATITRDIKVACDTLNLEGMIKRDAAVSCSNLNVNQNTARVYGNFEYTADKEAANLKNIVEGNVKFTEEIQENTVNIPQLIAKKYLANFIKTVVLELIVILIIIYLMPKFANKTEELIKNKNKKTLGYGVLALFLVPIISVLLMFTIIGIPAGLALIALYVFASTISSAIISIPLGKIICDKLNKNNKGYHVLFSILAVAVIWIIENLPFIGGIVSFVKFAVALGIIICAISKKNNKTDTVAQAEVIIEKNEDE